jgi:hypothetical protein
MLALRSIALWLFICFADVALAQSTFIPVSIGFPQIAIGGDQAGQNYITIIQIVNNNSAATTGRISLYGGSGAPLQVLFDGQGPQATLDLTLQPGQTRQIELSGAGEITAGWMDISYSPAAALTSVILQFRSGTTLLSEVGVDPAFQSISGTDFAAETDSTLNTGIAVANPTTSTAYVLALLWDPATGAQLASTLLTLPGRGHVSRLLTELFANIAGIAQMRAKVTLYSCSTAACNFLGSGFVATAIRLNGDQFTTIRVAQTVEGGSQMRVLPQVAFGGPPAGLNMKTVLYFTTNISSGVFGTASIFDSDGNPLAASPDGGAPTSSITFTVPGNRVTRIVLSGDQTLRSGWIRLSLSGTVHLLASAVFQTYNGSALVAEASVLDSLPIGRGLIYVRTRAGAANVGVAFANPVSEPNTLTLDLFNHEGFLAASREVTLPANGHLAQFVTELFPQLASAAEFDGALSIRTGVSSVWAVALRLSADKLATLPVAADGMYRPSITSLRIVSAQRSPAQVTFDLDLTDLDSNIATGSSSSVNAVVYMDFGSNVADFGEIHIDGAAILNRANGTLRGTFPSRVTGIPSGLTAAFYIVINDASGNASNVVATSVRF